MCACGSVVGKLASEMISVFLMWDRCKYQMSCRSVCLLGKMLVETNWVSTFKGIQRILNASPRDAWLSDVGTVSSDEEMVFY